jgi:hypothetical protein
VSETEAEKKVPNRVRVHIPCMPRSPSSSYVVGNSRRGGFCCRVRVLRVL